MSISNAIASGNGGGGPMSRQSLDPLVVAAKTGDPDAVEALLRVVKPAMLGYCRARMGGRDLTYLSAEDVVQDICVAVVKSLAGYEDQGGSFGYFVRAIAVNKVADAYRTVARDKSGPVPHLPETGTARNEPEEYVLQLDLRLRLKQFVSALPRTQQQVVTLRTMVGMSAEETGAALGISAGNVRVRHYRALRALRTMVGSEDL
ncbi:MAG: polymerase subunit sigma [Amycolatopsis sp.]|nr:polymerase subunit sigma [Amycolatopsis sp.]